MTDGVLPAVLGALEDRDGLSGVRPDRVTVGAAAVLVELLREDGERLAGLAHRPSGTDDAVTDRDLGALLDPIRHPEAGSGDGSIGRAAAVATVNALSVPYVEWRAGDPMALLAPSVDTVVTVGLFRPAFRKFDAVEVRVIERETTGTIAAPESVTVRQFTPDETEAAMRGADVVFVTGSTLVYGGLEAYLAATQPAATLVVVGATASFLPEPLFDRGVDVVAGAEVVDPIRAGGAVADGACGTDLHDRGVRKVYNATDSAADIDLPNHVRK